MSRLLKDCQTPEAWSENLMSHGVHVSPRLIRSKARATGHFFKIGRLMLLTPEQMETLLRPAGESSRADTNTSV